MNWEAMISEQRDALVAEYVFGRRVYKENTWGRWLLLRDDKAGLTEPIPAYTQSMDAAWLVVRYFATHLYDKPNGWSQADAFYTRVAERINGHYTVSLVTLADLTPEHICKAALQAVGVDIKEQE